MNKLFWFIYFAITLAMRCSCQFTCVPYHDCRYAEDGDLVPDPEECENYYTCVSVSSGDIVPSEHPNECYNGTYFDHTTATCITEPTPGICTNQCVNYCSIECPLLFIRYMLIANKSDCSYLAICMPDGSAARAQCPEETPYFNGSDCVTDESQCCNFCAPYCYDDFYLIPDPCDCTSYYNCEEVGPAYDANKMKCDNGLFFDENVGWCVNGTCSSLCSCI